MSTELRRALEQVAQRFRHARLWTGLTVCWLVWALAGVCLWLIGSQSGEKLIPDGWLLALARSRRGEWDRLRARRPPVGARLPLGGPAHRGQASRAGYRSPGRDRGRRGDAIRPARFLAIRRHSPGPRPPAHAIIGTKRCPPGSSGARNWPMGRRSGVLIAVADRPGQPGPLASRAAHGHCSRKPAPPTFRSIPAIPRSNVARRCLWSPISRGASRPRQPWSSKTRPRRQRNAA